MILSAPNLVHDRTVLGHCWDHGLHLTLLVCYGVVGFVVGPGFVEGLVGLGNWIWAELYAGLDIVSHLCLAGGLSLAGCGLAWGGLVFWGVYRLPKVDSSLKVGCVL